MERRYELFDKIAKYRLTRHSNIVNLDDVKPLELKAFRYLRQVKPNSFSKEIGVPMDEMLDYENPQKTKTVPKDIVERYVVALGITLGEHGKLRALLEGETDTYLTSRSIPKRVKDQVYKRDKGKCAKCGNEEDLHYHHIKPFSKGGKHTKDNLILVCKGCHVEEHRNDHYYNAMKSIFT